MNRICPITAEPLPPAEPGRILSKTACSRLRNAADGLAELMATINQMIAGNGRPKPEVPIRARATFPPAPLNLHVLAAIDDARDTLDIWANNLAQHANPSLRYTPGDWQAVQAIFTTYANLCAFWQHDNVEAGRLCVERVCEAIRHLQQIASPKEDAPMTARERDYATETLKSRAMPITPAIEAVRLLTGVKLNRQTIYSWERRGHITSRGTPKRFQVGELLSRVHTANVV